MKKKTLATLGLVGIVTVTLFFVLSADLNESSSKPIKISVGTWPGYGDIFVAQEKGIFEKNNVDVEIMFFESFDDSIDAYRNGQTDGGYTTWPEVITNSLRGGNSKVVYVVDLSTTGDSIIGIGDSLVDAQGKTIGIVDVDGFSHIFVLKALEFAGLTEDDVKFKIVPPENVLEELKTGKIIAGHVWEPYKTEAIKNGYRVLATDEQARIITDVLVFNSETIQKRPHDIKAIVKSLAEARQYRLAHTDEAISIMAKGEGMTDEEMRSGLEGLESFNLEDNHELLSSSEPNSLRSTGAFISEFYINIGQIPRIPNFADLIEPAFVREAIREQ